MVLSNFVHWSAKWILLLLAALVAVTARKWMSGTLDLPGEAVLPYTFRILVAAMGCGIVLGGLMALAIRPSLLNAAALADKFWQTNDRFVTAIEFCKRNPPTEFEKLALNECAVFAEKKQRMPGIYAPKELRWAIIPVAMIAVLLLDAQHETVARFERTQAAAREVSGTAHELVKLAEQLERKSVPGDEAKKLVEKLREAAGALRAGAKEGKDGEKAALQEISKLEALVREMKQQHAATPDELKALADALDESDATKEAAENIRRGKFAEAARKLDDAAKDPTAAAAAEKNLERAVEHLAQKKDELSKQVEQLRENSRQSPASSGRQQLLQQLSQMLNELQEQGKLTQGRRGEDGGKPGAGNRERQQAPGKEMSDDELKRMLGALQNMKNNDRQSEGGGEPQPSDGPEGQGEVEIANFGGKNPGSAQPGNGEEGEQAPTGQTSDQDEKGTTKDPFGDTTAASKGANDEALRGRLSEGESLSAMVPSAPGANETTKRRYRELYKAAASDAEDAVLQETIPLGARFMIKRYFESIRPIER
jgi:hypothetical protein